MKEPAEQGERSPIDSLGDWQAEGVDTIVERGQVPEENHIDHFEQEQYKRL